MTKKFFKVFIADKGSRDQLTNLLRYFVKQSIWSIPQNICQQTKIMNCGLNEKQAINFEFENKKYLQRDLDILFEKACRRHFFSITIDPVLEPYIQYKLNAILNKLSSTTETLTEHDCYFLNQLWGDNSLLACKFSPVLKDWLAQTRKTLQLPIEELLKQHSKAKNLQEKPIHTSYRYSMASKDYLTANDISFKKLHAEMNKIRQAPWGLGWLYRLYYGNKEREKCYSAFISQIAHGNLPAMPQCENEAINKILSPDAARIEISSNHHSHVNLFHRDSLKILAYSRKARLHSKKLQQKQLQFKLAREKPQDLTKLQNSINNDLAQLECRLTNDLAQLKIKLNQDNEKLTHKLNQELIVLKEELNQGLVTYENQLNEELALFEVKLNTLVNDMAEDEKNSIANSTPRKPMEFWFWQLMEIINFKASFPPEKQIDEAVKTANFSSPCP